MRLYPKGDGYCNDENNNIGCNYDGKDCCIDAIYCNNVGNNCDTNAACANTDGSEACVCKHFFGVFTW